MLLFYLLLTCGVALGASVGTKPPPSGDPPPAAREARSGSNSNSWSWPEPEWQSRQLAPLQPAVPAVAAAPAPPRSLRFTGDFQPSPNVELARDYRFEPYYRQDLSSYDRNRDRDVYDSPRYMDFNRQTLPPRRIIYYDDLSNRGKAPYWQQQQQQQQQPSNYDYRGYQPVRSPSIGVSQPYRYPDQGRNYNYNPNYNSILSEGTVENAPLVDDPYRSYNPRQPAPWSVQVGTSLTVKDDGRHSGNAARRYYVQSQRDEPALARSIGYPQSRAGDRLWQALQPRV